jgi:hypothetical protein
LIAIRAPVGRPTGSGNRWRAGAVSQVVRPPNPGRHFTRALCINAGSGGASKLILKDTYGNQTVIGVRKIYNIFSPICKFPGRIYNKHHMKRLVEMYISLKCIFPWQIAVPKAL